VDRDDPKAHAYALKLLEKRWDGFKCPPIEKMSFLVKIRDCLRQRGIACVVVIPPTYEGLAPTVASGDVGKELTTWRGQLASIFPSIVDLSFSPYNAATNFYTTDPIHFKPEVGVGFLNEKVLPYAAGLLTNAPSRFTNQ